MYKIVIVMLALSLCSCEKTFQTEKIKVDPSFFRNNMAAQDQDGRYLYEYTRNGATIFLEQDKNKAAELKIDSDKYYPNLDSLVITSEPVAKVGKFPVHLIKGVILAKPN